MSRRKTNNPYAIAMRLRYPRGGKMQNREHDVVKGKSRKQKHKKYPVEE